MKKIKTGLILGKFLPLHEGHLALIEFGLKHCDKLIVLVCSSEKEKIPGEIRVSWIKEYARDIDKIQVEYLFYNEDLLPNTSVSSKEVSRLWAVKLAELFPQIDVFFSSELYGDYLAEFLNIEHKVFDINRNKVSISASSILKDPMSNWDFIADQAKYWFVKKVVLLGSESTGKSILAEKLAKEFSTVHVPEMAREIVEHTKEVVPSDLLKIATLHAQVILEKVKEANKVLICDTDIHITASYAQYLFHQDLNVQEWIKQANKADLYLFLEPDCPFVQDGTRLSEKERNELSEHHKQFFKTAGLNYHLLNGSWDERFEQARKYINDTFF